MVSRCNDLLYRFSITIPLPLAVFTRQNTSEKTYLREMLIEQIVELELRRPGPLAVHLLL